MVASTPLNELRPFGVCVTDLSSQLWCEKQLELSLVHGPKPTEEMKIGNLIHEELESEVVTKVPVKVYTDEDVIALKLDNMLQRSLQLSSEGMTRELPIKSSIDGFFVHGIIDELVTDNHSTKIIDNKTRKSMTMPWYVQLRTVEFQLMLYKYMFESIQQSDFTPEQLLQYYSFNKKSSISMDFKKELKNKGLKIEPKLLKLCKLAFNSIKKLPLISNDLVVNYTHQGTRKFIGKHTFQFNPENFQRNLAFCKEYWHGERTAMPVGKSNRWKCKYCEFRDKCDVWV